MKSLRNHFIPHKENEYAPHILQTTAVVVMMVMVLLTFALANIQSLAWISSEWMLSAVLPSVVVTETNQERSREALQPLTRSEVLDEAAALKAKHMAQYGYFAHYSPDGKSPWYWFSQVDYNFIHAGENLAVHFKDSSQVVGAWMDSPTHRANIMNGEYQEIGIGVAEGKFEGYDTVFVVQLFGTPVRAYAPLSVTENEEVALAAEPVSEDAALRAETQVLGVNTDASSAIEAEPETVILPEDSFVATSSPFVGVADVDKSSQEVSELAVMATQPTKVLQMIYLALGLFVVSALSLSIGIEIRKQQPMQIAYGFALLTVMGGLWYLHTALTGTVLIL